MAKQVVVPFSCLVCVSTESVCVSWGKARCIRRVIPPEGCVSMCMCVVINVRQSHLKRRGLSRCLKLHLPKHCGRRCGHHPPIWHDRVATHGHSHETASKECDRCFARPSECPGAAHSAAGSWVLPVGLNLSPSRWTCRLLLAVLLRWAPPGLHVQLGGRAGGPNVL